MKFDYYEGGKWIQGFESMDDATLKLWPVKKTFFKSDAHARLRHQAVRQLQLSGNARRGAAHVKCNTIRINMHHSNPFLSGDTSEALR